MFAPASFSRTRSALRGTLAILLLTAAPTFAQTTLTLQNANATTLRGGTYADTNFGSADIIETRASADPTYERRALLKFDTHTSLAPGTPIVSATLTLTGASGSNTEPRSLTAFNVKSPYEQLEATWNVRSSSVAWLTPGGDVGDRYGFLSTSGTPGSQVTVDVTTLVAAAVRGDFGNSRDTQILLVDEGASSRGSYKQFYSDRASNPSQRPTLTIVAADGPPPGTKLRVLQWNIHHGGFGEDGVYSPDRIANWVATMAPDVVSFNEIEKNVSWWGNEDQPEVYKALLQQKTGKTWYYVFAQEFGQWTANGKGNLILSSLPIEALDRYELVNNNDRSIAMARISVGGRPITLLSTHLDPYDQSLRLLQATETMAWAETQPENRILAGDMNAWPDQTSIAQLNTRYNDSWAVADANGSATAFPGNNGQTKNGRIDYIFYSKTSPNLSVLSSQVYDTRDANGLMPSDHRPVLTTFLVQ